MNKTLRHIICITGLLLVAACDDWQTIQQYQVKDDLVKADDTGLMWMRCSVGQQWSGSTCEGTAIAADWYQIIHNLSRFNYAGYDDWRLPTQTELRTIVYCSSHQTQSLAQHHIRCAGHYLVPTIEQNVFPNTPTQHIFWTVSTAADHKFSQFNAVISFADGDDMFADKNGAKGFVRLVRTQK